jgi:hypothetical protein
MEDFNEIFENNDEIKFTKDNSNIEEILYQLKIKLANENYNSIIEHGIDFDIMKSQRMDVNRAISTLTHMINIFEELEEYEKCANIKQIIDSSKI